MRTFAMLVMLLNIVYFIWGQIRTEDSVVEILPGQSFFMPAEQSLVMLAEIPRMPPSPQEHEEKVVETDDQVPEFSEPDAENETSVLANAGQNELPRAWCEMVSGFDDQDEAAAFLAEIGEMGIAGSLDVQQEQVSSIWWVHLPPFKSQSEAQIVINELVAKGIDNFYIRTGELAGGVSLGVFSREQSAVRAQAEFIARGYTPSVTGIPRYDSKAYVTIQASDPRQLEDLEWKAFLATKTKLEVTEKLCETIARKIQFP